MTNHRLEMAIAIIVFFTVLNCFSVHFGGAVQTVMTAVKILMIFGLAASILTFGAGTSWHHLGGAASSAGWKSWSGFGLAVLAALWAFDGWNNLSMAAGEIRDPDRVIPQSLAWGLIAVLFLYVGANLAYFYALPFEEVVNSNSTLYPDALPVATKAALQSFGGAAVAILSVAFVFSALGAMNGTILTGARVPYAMARDGLMWSWLGEANPRTHSPVGSTIVQGLWACVLARLGHLRPTHELYRVCVVDLLRAQRIQFIPFSSQTSGACLSDARVPLDARHLHRLRTPADRQHALDSAERKFGRISPDCGGNPGLFPVPQLPLSTGGK